MVKFILILSIFFINKSLILEKKRLKLNLRRNLDDNGVETTFDSSKHFDNLQDSYWLKEGFLNVKNKIFNICLVSFLLILAIFSIIFKDNESLNRSMRVVATYFTSIIIIVYFLNFFLKKNVGDKIPWYIRWISSVKDSILTVVLIVFHIIIFFVFLGILTLQHFFRFLYFIDILFIDFIFLSLLIKFGFGVDRILFVLPFFGVLEICKFFLTYKFTMKDNGKFHGISTCICLTVFYFANFIIEKKSIIVLYQLFVVEDLKYKQIIYSIPLPLHLIIIVLFRIFYIHPDEGILSFNRKKAAQNMKKNFMEMFK